MNKSMIIKIAIVVFVVICVAIITQRPTEVLSPTTSISMEDALVVAQWTKECSMAGILSDRITYNENSKTWWIDLDRMPEVEKDGCNPACVVSEETKTAEVNWRCTGAIPPEPKTIN